MTSSILITGVAGFIGSNLAERLLLEGNRVVGVDNLAYGVIEQVPDGVEFYRGDIRDPATYRLYERAEVVFHLAAKNCITDCQTDPVETFDINVRGTASVFEACRRARVRKVVYAESSAVYEGITKLPSVEDVTAPISFYALSKESARFVAQGYQEFAGLVTTGLRYFCVYGPRQDYRRTIPPVMSAFIIKLCQGARPTIYGSGEKRRDFVYVDDVNAFHLRCVSDARTDGRTFNLGTGRSYSVREVFDLVRRQLGEDHEPIFEADLPGEAHETRADISAARAIGWEPKVGIEDGVRRSIEYIREHVLSQATTGAMSE